MKRRNRAIEFLVFGKLGAEGVRIIKSKHFVFPFLSARPKIVFIFFEKRVLQLPFVWNLDSGQLYYYCYYYKDKVIILQEYSHNKISVIGQSQCITKGVITIIKSYY